MTRSTVTTDGLNPLSQQSAWDRLVLKTNGRIQRETLLKAVARGHLMPGTGFRALRPGDGQRSMSRAKICLNSPGWHQRQKLWLWCLLWRVELSNPERA